MIKFVGEAQVRTGWPIVSGSEVSQILFREWSIEFRLGGVVMVKSTSGSPEIGRVRYNHDSDAWGHGSDKFRYALIDPTTGPKRAPSCPGQKRYLLKLVFITAWQRIAVRSVNVSWTSIQNHKALSTTFQWMSSKGYQIRKSYSGVEILKV